MPRIMLSTLAFMAMAVFFCSPAARAYDPAELLGGWQCLQAEEGVLYRFECGEDGVFLLQVFSAEAARYRLDRKNNRLGIVEPAWDEESAEYVEWVDFNIKRDVLTISQDEMVLEFDRVWKPEEMKNALAGRWVLRLEAGDGMWEEGVSQEFALQFNNDGSASVQELGEELTGGFQVADDGTISLELEDETGTAVYDGEAGTLTVTIDGESHVFTRLV